jgi:hypothetical protein
VKVRADVNTRSKILDILRMLCCSIAFISELA